MGGHGIFSRRQVLSASVRLAPLIVAPLMAVPRAAGAAAGGCPATAAQSEGPFYPTAGIATRDNLILPAQDGSGVMGERIVVAGQVTAGRCMPVAAAEVEIWQADSRGRYHHPQESSGQPLDARFLYWGKTLTDGEGRYRFVTIAPAPYSAGRGWTRPPHIHFKVRKAPKAGGGGRGELTTQMYFPGHPLNGRDFLHQAIPARLRHTVIAVPVAAPAGAGPPSPHFRFDIALA